MMFDNIFFLLSSLAMGVRGGVFTLTFARLNLRLRNHLFRTLMRQEIAFFDENHTGDVGTQSIHLSIFDQLPLFMDLI